MATIHQIAEVYVDIKQPVAATNPPSRFEGGALVEERGIPVALLSTDGVPYREKGRLLFTDVDVDPSTSEVTLRVLAENPDARLLPGMFVRAEITFGEDPGAFLVPEQAVQRNASLGAHVLVVTGDDTIASLPVVPGRVIAGRYVVSEGLSRGDRVVVEGLERLVPGAKVRPVPWKPKTTSKAKS